MNPIKNNIKDNNPNKNGKLGKSSNLVILESIHQKKQKLKTRRSLIMIKEHKRMVTIPKGNKRQQRKNVINNKKNKIPYLKNQINNYSNNNSSKKKEKKMKKKQLQQKKMKKIAKMK